MNLGRLDSSLHLMQFDSIHGKLPVEIKKLEKVSNIKIKQSNFLVREIQKSSLEKT